MKRVLLFIATNLAVVLVLGVVLNIVFSVLGINSRSIGGMLVFCAVFGFGGAIISLLISKWMAKRSYGVQVIEQPRNEMEHWLLSTVQRQAQQAGIGMPEVGIYDSPDMNAFATGASRNNSLVAVSTGLMYSMSRDEAEAVLAHEVSHIANGDMVTLTLIQGVVNTFVMFFARIVANVISGFFSNSEEEEGGGMGGIAYFITVMVLEMLFGILASIIVMWFSRQREYRADEGGARLAGREKMIAALERLRHGHESQLEGSLAAFGINGKQQSELLMSHPPLEKRIHVLRTQR
ncbi:protease HtpX [Oceanimonas baumannii]|uniref:Protease HtpX n=1 Tax=Oceanimonas baumannii TaxID=129578 RepID=A0A235CL72_9GAMM|nr:protease HtpX [Oceanimonas baumannii]MCC4263855.1 protease HtpX [Oceanimonas baumannii]OYD25186.1 zinc metalloprotease HtpX [Oceanimonas baumannii]TDW62524.1 heat shock protein HtpX [Oceanimonas baumannii]